MARLILFLLYMSTILNLATNWRVDIVPRLYGDRVSNRMISTHTKHVQRRIVMMHDYFRTKVYPPASNMLSMKWHKGAARAAQNWADQCRFLVHDSQKGRSVHNFGACGQNIFVSTHKVPWKFAMRTWFVERNNFTYGSTENNLGVIGHYTQMVWAATHKVGCGISKCSYGGPRNKPFFNYVCNYCPTGNFPATLGYPYKVGRPCGLCGHSCRSRSIQLCTNSCNGADQWSNCRELYKSWPTWLCHTKSHQGLERQQNCVATCKCKGKIFD